MGYDPLKTPLFDYAVWTAPHPAGPYTLVHEATRLAHYRSYGDFNLFVDADDAAYIVYNAGWNDAHSEIATFVDRLTDDFTASSNQSSQSFANSSEASAMIKIGSEYMVITGFWCCWCSDGN